MVAKIIVSLALLGTALSFPFPETIPQYIPVKPHVDQYSKPHIDPYKPQTYKEEKRPYAFDYGVKDDYTGANFGHQEDSDGNTIKGSYTVALPDGRIQRVSYVADHYNGFQAEVTYEGQATYPDNYEAPQQPYKPRPQYFNAQPSYSGPQYKEESPIVYEDSKPEYS